MSAAGGAPDPVLDAATLYEIGYGDALAAGFDVFVHRTTARLRSKVRAFSTDDDQVKIAAPGSIATEGDWLAALDASGLVVAVEAGFGAFATAAAAEVAGVVTVAPDMGALVKTTVAGVEGWAPSMRTAVTDAVQAGIDQGVSVKEIAARIESSVYGIDGTRAQSIARTETNAAMNASRTFVHDLTDRPYFRMWSAVPDSRVRFDHAAAHGQVRRRGDLFTVGGESLEYPGDPGASAGQRRGCRCTVLLSFNRWSPEELAADRSEWSGLVRSTADADGVPVPADIGGLLT